MIPSSDMNYYHSKVGKNQTNHNLLKENVTKLTELESKYQFPTYQQIIFENECLLYHIAFQMTLQQINKIMQLQSIKYQPYELNQFEKKEQILKNMIINIEYFLQLTPEDICIFFDRRTTMGSVDNLPTICFEDLIKVSQQLIKNDMKRTVLNKAICKHFHRSDCSYWGVITGSIERINELSNDKLEKLLNSCCFLNFHQLMQGLICYEIRNQDGWGIRFTYNQKQFIYGEISNQQLKGLLEPFLPD